MTKRKVIEDNASSISGEIRTIYEDYISDECCADIEEHDNDDNLIDPVKSWGEYPDWSKENEKIQGI